MKGPDISILRKLDYVLLLYIMYICVTFDADLQEKYMETFIEIDKKFLWKREIKVLNKKGIFNEFKSMEG